MPIIHDDAFRAWEACVPKSLRDDPMWKFHAYRVSAYLLDLAQRDMQPLRRRRAFPHQTDQLLRAAASVSANVSEGLGRNTSTDRAHYFAFAMGSLRETITWYRALQHELPAELIELRYEQLGELRRILTGAQKWLATKPQSSHLF